MLAADTSYKMAGQYADTIGYVEESPQIVDDGHPPLLARDSRDSLPNRADQ